MKNYYLKRITEKLDWEDIPVLEVDEIMWLGDAGIRMKQQLLYDSDAIYVHQTAFEKNIREEERDSLSQVCNDSCMEFFFDLGCDNRYFNFEINPLGTIYLGFGKERKERIRIIDKNPKERFDIRAAHTEDGWEVFYKIPLSFIRMFYPDYQFESGKRFRANCYKCGDKTTTPHYLAWNRLNCENPDYHRPEDFGLMIFE